MEQHLTVTLARLRDAAELYRQLDAAQRHRDDAQQRQADLLALDAEYAADQEEAGRSDRDGRDEVRRLTDELAALTAKLADRRQRAATEAKLAAALAVDIASLERCRDELQARIREVQEQTARAGAALAADATVAADARAGIARQREVLADCGRQAEAAVPEITEELAHLLRLLPPRVAGRLAQIARRHGDPVADLVQGACAGCGQTLPFQHAVDADREAALVICQGCGRYIIPRSSRRTRG